MFDNINQDYVLLFLIFALGIYLYTRKENFMCINGTIMNNKTSMFKEPTLWQLKTNASKDSCCKSPRLEAMIELDDGTYYFCREIRSKIKILDKYISTPGQKIALKPEDYINMNYLPKTFTGKYIIKAFVTLYT